MIKISILGIYRFAWWTLSEVKPNESLKGKIEGVPHLIYNHKGHNDLHKVRRG